MRAVTWDDDGVTGAPDPQRRSLRALVDRLHPAVLDFVAAPRGLDIGIGDTLILDPSESLPSAPGAVVLAVGVDTDRARVALLRQLADAGAAVAIVKIDEPPDAVVRAAAEETGVAVLGAPSALSWGQLYSLLVTASAAAPAADGAQPQVPLGDLFSLANAVAAMVGGATTIEDPHNRVLAYSNLGHPIDPPREQTILGRQVPTEWIRRLQAAGVFGRLWHTDDVIRIRDFVADEDLRCRPRIAVAVRAGGETLGSLWVVEGHQPLPDEAGRTLREAADIAALHLLRHRSAADVERRRRAEALVAVLDGKVGDHSRDVLGMPVGRPVTVAAFDVTAGTPEVVMAAQRVADLVAVYCESYRRQAACAASGGRIYALLPVDADGTGGSDAAVALARSIVDRAAAALQLRLHAGVGSVVPGLDDVAHSRREADEVLDVLAGGTGPEVAPILAVRERVVLHRLRQLAALHPELAAGRVTALAEQDAAKGTSWVATLRAYFDAFGDMARAAAAVNVHPNTFRYRLRRIGEVFGLDLTDPDERLVAELQLRFLDRD